MTDRINAITVILDRDTREDDVKPILNAIKMIKGILVATPHVTDDINSCVANYRVKRQLEEKIYKILDSKDIG